MAKKQPLTIKAPDRPVPAPRQSTPPIYELSTTALDDRAISVMLPPEADGLSEPLRELATRLIGARRRVGEALLEAARYLSEARTAAEEGQWYVFLRVTGTSPDSAETLLNIHHRAAQHHVFAEKIRSSWLNQTVAGELAKPATSPAVLQELLEQEGPLRVADVKRARRLPILDRDDDHNVDNPNYSGSSPGLKVAPSPISTQADVVSTPGDQAVLATRLRDVAASLEAIAAQAHALSPDATTQHALSRIAQALAALQRELVATA